MKPLVWNCIRFHWKKGNNAVICQCGVVFALMFIITDSLVWFILSSIIGISVIHFVYVKCWMGYWLYWHSCCDPCKNVWKFFCFVMHPSLSNFWTTDPQDWWICSIFVFFFCFSFKQWWESMVLRLPFDDVLKTVCLLQLVKNVFLTHERKMSRKFVEGILSLILERRLSKWKILYSYLNKVSISNSTITAFNFNLFIFLK